MTSDDEPGEEEFGPELCDLCGAVVSDGSEFYALAPDSSVVYSQNPKFNGKRWLTACSREHLAELVQEYKRRPFVDEELWAGKIRRAIDQHDGQISTEALMTETGLDQGQIERAVEWQNREFLRWRRRFGRGENPDAPGE